MAEMHMKNTFDESNLHRASAALKRPIAILSLDHYRHPYLKLIATKRKPNGTGVAIDSSLIPGLFCYDRD
jgi:hypothetical protein